MQQLEKKLEQGQVVVLDGATSTELQRRGVPMHGEAWSGVALRTHPDVVRQVHESYIRAGADIITANTFSTGRPILEAAGMGGLVEELNTGAVTTAIQAREAAAGDRPVLIAGSISTFSSGIPPEFMPSGEGAKALYAEQAQLLAQAGVDLIALEMMLDVEQTRYAIEAAISTGLPVWVGFSCKPSEDGEEVLLLHSQGETFGEALPELLAVGGSLMSVMHTEVQDVAPALEVLKQHWTGPIGAYPHSGGWLRPNWLFDDVIPPQDFVAEAAKWVEMGVQVLGGCCGLGPEHISALKEGSKSWQRYL